MLPPARVAVGQPADVVPLDRVWNLVVMSLPLLELQLANLPPRRVGKTCAQLPRGTALDLVPASS